MKLPVGYVAGVGVVKATAYGGFGEKMLKSMGWQDGQGLGKEGTGMKKAIEVKKKEDTNGVRPRLGRRRGASARHGGCMPLGAPRASSNACLLPRRSVPTAATSGTTSGGNEPSTRRPRRWTTRCAASPQPLPPAALAREFCRPGTSSDTAEPTLTCFLLRNNGD